MKRIQKKINSLIIVMFLAVQLIQAKNIEHIFITMPDLVNPVLSRQGRFELVEYYKAGMGDSITNNFDRQSHLVVMDTTTNYIKIRNTDISTFEMKIFVEGKDSVIGVIRTIQHPLWQSMIDFYNMDWSPSTVKFEMPKAIDWVDEDKKGDKDAVYQSIIKNLLSVDFISLSFDASADAIIAQSNSLEYLSEADKNFVQVYVNSTPFIYHKNKKKWRKQ